MSRIANISRETSESKIELELNLDGSGKSVIQTGVPFFDHMLTAFSKHSLIDLKVKAVGDIEIDVHHTVEDTAIVLGQALKQALGDKSGIARYGDAPFRWTRRWLGQLSIFPADLSWFTRVSLRGLSIT